MIHWIDRRAVFINTVLMLPWKLALWEKYRSTGVHNSRQVAPESAMTNRDLTRLPIRAREAIFLTRDWKARIART